MERRDARGASLCARAAQRHQRRSLSLGAAHPRVGLASHDALGRSHPCLPRLRRWCAHLPGYPPPDAGDRPLRSQRHIPARSSRASGLPVEVPSIRGGDGQRLRIRAHATHTRCRTTYDTSQRRRCRSRYDTTCRTTYDSSPVGRCRTTYDRFRGVEWRTTARRGVERRAGSCRTSFDTLSYLVRHGVEPRTT